MPVPRAADGHHNRLTRRSPAKCRNQPADYSWCQEHEVDGIYQKRSVFWYLPKSGKKGTELPSAPLPIYREARLACYHTSDPIRLITEHDNRTFEAVTILHGNLDRRATREFRERLRKWQ